MWLAWLLDTKLCGVVSDVGRQFSGMIRPSSRPEVLPKCTTYRTRFTLYFFGSLFLTSIVLGIGQRRKPGHPNPWTYSTAPLVAPSNYQLLWSSTEPSAHGGLQYHSDLKYR